MTRFGYVMAALFAATVLAIPFCVSMPVRFVWNASASVPIGLYVIEPPHHLAVGDLVAVMLGKPLGDLMVARGYIGPGAPLMKHVAALPGQQVCRYGNTVTVDAVPFGNALDHDRQGRPLPVWQGCERVAGGDIFLMNPDVPDSLDGRYFGPIALRTVIGKATPLYTDEAGDGCFVWRAATY